MRPVDLFVLTGEMSGDQLAGPVVKVLKEKHPEWSIEAVGGPLLRELGVKNVMPMENFQVMGFSAVMKALPRLIRNFRSLKRHILRENPRGVLFVDYPGFNLRMAKTLRKSGYKGKLIQYVCPSVWAWGKGRVGVLARHYDRLLTLFPFESKCFSETTLPVDYVGHPLPKRLESYPYDGRWREKVGLRRDDPLLAVFPGSREAEVRLNFPVQMAAVKCLLRDNPKMQVAVSMMHPHLHREEGVVFVPKEYTFELMRESRAALAKSGTVTLELALHGVPTVVTYGLSRFNQWVAESVLRLDLPHYCLVNILGEKSIFPERIVAGFDPESLAKIAQELWDETEQRHACLEGCKAVSQLLAGGDPATRAAIAIEEELL